MKNSETKIVLRKILEDTSKNFGIKGKKGKIRTKYTLDYNNEFHWTMNCFILLNKSMIKYSKLSAFKTTEQPPSSEHFT